MEQNPIPTLSERSAILTVRYATPSEFEQIHQFNHAIFAEEIPQHKKQPSAKLVDPFHALNTYLIAKEGEELVGMVCYNAVRPFSLDKKMANIDSYLPTYKNMVEVRLFAVKKSKRKQHVAYAILKKLLPDLIHKGYDLAVMSATVKELKLYRHLGAIAFGSLVGTKEVPYQPMYLHLDNLKQEFRP